MQHFTTQRFGQSRLAQLVRKYWLALGVFLSAGTVALVVIGQTAPPVAINLSSDPLFAAANADKPTMALALSVEFPTVGAQYVASPGATSDATYSNATEYLGYYDSEACYTYNDAPTETIPADKSTADYKRFDRVGAATNRMCTAAGLTNSFSGNFLNWSSSSAIDMLRLALSGGDRYIDTPNQYTSSNVLGTPSLTVLQRAVIPNGDPTCMWNSGNFPAKKLERNGGSSGSAYYGAVPATMQQNAGTSPIWVANTLNRIYFGTSQGGGCGNTAAYNLGTSTSTAAFGPITNRYSTRTGALAAFGGTLCGSENGSCDFTGVREVLYGAEGTSNSNGGWISFPAYNGVACSNDFSGSFIDPAPGTVKQCFTRPYTGTWRAPASASGMNSDGFFYARVRVCDTATTTPFALQDVRDYGFCSQYPNGSYKPTGSIQKYSDQLRLAAFGYLMDQTQSSAGGRYGGVLRAPMKFVGSKTFNESGVENTPTGGNPNAEWNSVTGVLVSNPDGDTSQTPNISGIINYLNKFGRTGPTQGLYKKFDPVGELYGEALRYLQGLGPTTAAISGLNTNPSFYDGFPVYTNWTDPFGGSRSPTDDYSCLKSNIVVIGDVNTHDSNTLLNRTADPANNIQNFNYWKGVVTNFEAGSGANYLDGQNVSRAISNPNTSNSSAQSVSSGSQVLTGQAYWAHTHDIRGSDWTAGSGPTKKRPGLRVKSFFFDVNENASANDDSYRRNRNQFFTSAKYGGFQSDPSNIGGNPYNAFGNPFKRQDGTNDNNVWQDANAPSEASTYYRLSSGRNTLQAFDTIFARAATSARSIAGSAAASKNITQVGSVIYQGAFDTTDWSGDVFAIPLLVSAANNVTVGATNLWSAATRLTNRSSPSTTRNIVVGRTSATANPNATAFTWSAIDPSLQVNLAKTSPVATADLLGQDRLNYLRGDSSKEGSPFRRRNKLLGDVVNSAVVYSGTPTASLTSNGYPAFYAANSSRTPAVFVGANDGMMHAFNANNGDELFGYIPSWMGPKLAALTTSGYNNSHQSYVDASPVVAEAKVGLSETDASAAWKTVLVSGTGGGGPGVFALDVTNPSSFNASKVMWEFTRADDPDLGYVVGRPQIVKLRTSAWTAAPAYRWFAVVASGINNYVTDTTGSFTAATINTTGGNPALFLLALDKPAGTAWTASGSTPNYYKISLPVDSALSATNAPGLINFRVAFGASGDATQIYMGDLHGKLWKLDFTLNDPRDTLGASNWTMNKLSAFKKTISGTSTAYPLYIAQTAANAVQPISMAPSVVAGPVVGGVATSYIAFATGKYLEVLDKASTAQNTIYAVYDNNGPADSTPVGASVISGRGRLQTGTASVSAGTITVPPFTWGRAASNADTSQRSGWYVDFATSGERGISSSSVFGDSLVFGSLIPGAAATGSCSASGGGGYQYRINIDTGNGTFVTSTVGILGEPLLAEIVSAVQYTVSSSTGRRIKTVVKQVIQQGSLGVGASTSGTLTETFVTGRLSWRQINNYQDLKR